MDKCYYARTSIYQRDAKDSLLPAPEKRETNWGKHFNTYNKELTTQISPSLPHTAIISPVSEMAHPPAQASPFPVVPTLSPSHLLHGGPISTLAHPPE